MIDFPQDQSGHTKTGSSGDQRPVIAVVGGDLAGLRTAYELTRHGYRVDIYDAARHEPDAHAASDADAIQLARQLNIGLREVPEQAARPLSREFVHLERALADERGKLRDHGGHWTAHAMMIDHKSADAFLRQKALENGVSPAALAQFAEDYRQQNGTTLSEVSALAFIDHLGQDVHRSLADVGHMPAHTEVEGGIERLEQELLSRMGTQATYHPGQVLTSIERDGRGRVLNFRKDDGGNTVAEVDVVILSLPRAEVSTVLGLEQLGINSERAQALSGLHLGAGGALLPAPGGYASLLRMGEDAAQKPTVALVGPAMGRASVPRESERLLRQLPLIAAQRAAMQATSGGSTASLPIAANANTIIRS